MSRLRNKENGETFELSEGQVYYVGRHQLGVTDKRVSRRQLQLSLRGPALAVTVEGVNPVYVRRAGKEEGEQELLSRGEEAILRPGDVVALLAELHPLVFEYDSDSDDVNQRGFDEAKEKHQEAINSKRKLPLSDDEDKMTGENEAPQSNVRVVYTKRRSETQGAPKRVLSAEEELMRQAEEQREEAAVDEAAAREVVQAAMREIEKERRKQEEADRRLAAQMECEEQTEHHHKRRIIEKEEEVRSPSTSSSSSKNHHSHRRGNDRRGSAPARRRAGGRHAARVAKEKMSEYLELVDQAAAESRALREEDGDSEEDTDKTPEHFDPFNSDAFDAAEWKRNAEDSSGDEDHVSEGSGDEGAYGDGEKPACKYGAACYRRNPDHLRGFYHPPRE